MESKGNNNICDDASKGDREESEGAVKTKNCDNELNKKTNGDVENGVNIEKHAVRIEETLRKTGNGSIENTNDEEKTKNFKAMTETEKNCTKISSKLEEKIENKARNNKFNEVNAKNSNKTEIVVIQKPKRTKSRKSLKKMPSINSIDVDRNPSINRTDR